MIASSLRCVALNAQPYRLSILYISTRRAAFVGCKWKKEPTHFGMQAKNRCGSVKAGFPVKRV